MIGQLQQQILRLNKEERLRLIQYIVDSIRYEDAGFAGMPPEQEVELERRAKLVEEGSAEFLTWEEIKASLKK